MIRCACLFVAALGVAASVAQAAAPPRSVPNGVYAVLRDGTTMKDVLPLADGEAVVVHRHRYLKTGGQPPRFVAVRVKPDVILDLAGAPTPIKDGDEIVGLHLKLRPKAAAALERLTRERKGGQVAIVIGGEVVTMHKVRGPIKDGDVQITSCAPKAAGYLLEQLQARINGR